MLQGTILKTFYGRLSLNNKITTGVHMVAGLEWSAVAFLHGITKILMSDPKYIAVVHSVFLCIS